MPPDRLCPAARDLADDGWRATTFGGELLTKVTATIDGNVVLSPDSVAVAFAMPRGGAAGDTRQQVDRALHLEGVNADNGFDALDRALATRTGQIAPPDGRKLVLILRDLETDAVFLPVELPTPRDDRTDYP